MHCVLAEWERTGGPIDDLFDRIFQDAAGVVQLSKNQQRASKIVEGLGQQNLVTQFMRSLLQGQDYPRKDRVGQG